MAVLSNGIITIDFGSVTWVTDMNTNFNSIATIAGTQSLFDGKALATHNHDALYELSTTTIDQTWLQPILQDTTEDIKFTNNTEGLVLVDITVADNKRIYLDNGVLSTEVVV